VLGTDGFGRSETRAALRDFFEVDYRYVIVATLAALARDGKIDASIVDQAIKAHNINPEEEQPGCILNSSQLSTLNSQRQPPRVER